MAKFSATYGYHIWIDLNTFTNIERLPIKYLDVLPTVIHRITTNQIFTYNSNPLFDTIPLKWTKHYEYTANQIHGFNTNQILRYNTNQMLGCATNQILRYNTNQIHGFNTNQILRYNTNQIHRYNTNQYSWNSKGE